MVRYEGVRALKYSTCMSPHSWLPPLADMRVLIARVRRAIIVYCHFAEAPNLYFTRTVHALWLEHLNVSFEF